MFFGGRGMVLGLIVLAARVVVLCLMMVMRGRMVVAGRGVMMLLRRMFCHFSVLRRSLSLVLADLNRPLFPVKNEELCQILANRESWQ